MKKFILESQPTLAEMFPALHAHPYAHEVITQVELFSSAFVCVREDERCVGGAALTFSLDIPPDTLVIYFESSHS